MYGHGSSKKCNKREKTKQPYWLFVRFPKIDPGATKMFPVSESLEVVLTNFNIHLNTMLFICFLKTGQFTESALITYVKRFLKI